MRNGVIWTKSVSGLRGILVAAVCCLFLLSAVSAWGQTETGQIAGTVTDATGAVVVNAKVVVKSVTTGLLREATTNSAGLYAFPSLRPDVYDVSVEASGFRTVKKQVTVTVGSISEASVQLEVGRTSETVEVVATGGAVEVNLENQTLSQTVTSQQLEELPTSPTRNPYALVATSGNVTEDTNANSRGAGFAINGLRSSSTNILLDGAENVDTFTSGIGQTIPLDSVQEFSVLTNNFSSEFGRASGGVVDLVTKSGTNDFHGSAYEYNRVSHLSSNTFVNNATDTPKGVFVRNNFGFSVGGPVKKDKLFFFNNAEWLRVRSSAPTLYNILDPSSYSLLDASSQAYFAAYGKLVSNVRTIASGPCQNTGTGATLTCDVVSFSAPSDAGGGLPQNTTMEVARVDWNITDRTTFFARYALYKELDFPGTVNSSPYAGYNTGQTNFDQNYEFTFAHFFSPSLGNTVKAIYNRLNGPVQPLGTNAAAPTLYIDPQVSSTLVAGFTNPMIFPGYSETTPGNGIPFGGPQNLYQVHDDVSWVKGRHQIKFGGQYIQIRDNRVFGAYENPVEELGKTVTAGFTNLVAGQIYQFQGAVYPQGKFPCERDPNTGAYIQTPACTLTLPVGSPAFNRNYRYNDGAWYVQDAWKIVPRFTLNLGLRWEYFGVQHNANRALDSNFVMGPGVTIFDRIRDGAVELAQNGGYFWKPDYGDFGPHVGFAWDLFGNGKTSLRGGFMKGYERNFGNVTFNAIQNPPNYAVVSLINQSVNGGTGDIPTMPVYTDKSGPLAGTGTKALPAVSQRAIDQNIKTAYAETWNMSVDRSVGKGVFSVAYVGSHGVHLYDIANVNPSKGGGTFLGDARAGNRLNLQYSNMNFRSDHGYSHYDGMNLKYAVTNLMNKGLGLTANYTYSHSLDNLSSTFTETYGGISGAYQLGYLDGFNPQLNYGNADYDIRHRLNLAATWESPYFKGSDSRLVKNVLGGWGAGAILNIRSGMPFTLYDCTNANDTGCPLYAPAQAIPRTGSSTAIGGSANNFNYIQIPDGGSNLGVSSGFPTCTGLYHVGCTYTSNGQPYPLRNQFFGPGFWNMDMSFYKTFTLTERFKLQFRSEFYNIFNHSNAYIQGLNLDVSSMTADAQGRLFVQTEKGGIYGYAGQPTDERRNIQFALRLMF